MNLSEPKPPTQDIREGDGDEDPGIGSLRFEEAIQQLEAIIDGIESGQSGLEQSLASYERGMKVITRCRSILDTAQKRIAELTVDRDGQLQIADGESHQDDDTASQ